MIIPYSVIYTQEERHIEKYQTVEYNFPVN